MNPMKRLYSSGSQKVADKSRYRDAAVVGTLSNNSPCFPRIPLEEDGGGRPILCF